MCRARVKTPTTKSAEEALAALMRQCARSERSSGDAMRLMARWGVEPSSRVGVLEHLIAEKFIDDRRYAAAYVREKLNLSGWGARKIASTLRTKGVSEEIIRDELSELDSELMQDRLSEKLERKARVIKYKDLYDKRNKLLRFAVSLGYDYDMAQRAVSQVIKCDEE